MRPLAYVWPYAVVFWIVFVWVFAPEFRLTGRTRSLARTQDAGSLWVIMVVQCLAMGAAFSIAFVFRFGVLPRQQLWFWVGLATLIAGSLLSRLHAAYKTVHSEDCLTEVVSKSAGGGIAFANLNPKELRFSPQFRLKLWHNSSCSGVLWTLVENRCLY
jgi:hypothetical protein